MGCNVLPQAQALFMIPRTVPQSPLKKVGFFPSVVVNSSSRVSPVGCRLVSSGFSGTRNRHSFVVRAEAEGEGEEKADAEPEPEPEPEANAVATEEAEGESVAEVEEKPPKKPIVKLGDIMGILHKQGIEAANERLPIPDLRSGDIIEVKWTRPSRKRGFAIYKGIVISKQNAGTHTTVRVRRVVAGCGVEIIIPIYSPNVQELKVLSHRKVRRARLYYLKDKLPRFSTFK